LAALAVIDWLLGGTASLEPRPFKRGAMNTHDIYLKDSTVSFQRVTGVSAVIVGATLLFVGSPASVLLIVAGILQLVVASRAKGTPIVRVGCGRLEVNLGAWNRHTIRLAEIRGVEDTPKALIVRTSRDRLSIPLKTMEGADAIKLRELLAPPARPRGNKA
jgi:hypothetical protein